MQTTVQAQNQPPPGFAALLQHYQPRSLLYCDISPQPRRLATELTAMPHCRLFEHQSVALDGWNQQGSVAEPAITERNLQQSLQRVDLACVVGLLEHHSATACQQFLAQLRDVLTPVVAVWVKPQQSLALNRQAMTALGFSYHPAPELAVEDAKPAAEQITTSVNTPEIALYQFDIAKYKPTPDWLNPKNWANPQLWDRYRW